MKVRLRHYYNVIDYDSYFGGIIYDSFIIRKMNRENTGSMTTYIPTYYRPGYLYFTPPIFSMKCMLSNLSNQNVESMHMITVTSYDYS